MTKRAARRIVTVLRCLSVVSAGQTQLAWILPLSSRELPSLHRPCTGMLVAQMHEAHGANEGRAVFFLNKQDLIDGIHNSE
jgi:hypothetical protein